MVLHSIQGHDFKIKPDCLKDLWPSRVCQFTGAGNKQPIWELPFQMEASPSGLHTPHSPNSRLSHSQPHNHEASSKHPRAVHIAQSLQRQARQSIPRLLALPRRFLPTDPTVKTPAHHPLKPSLCLLTSAHASQATPHGTAWALLLEICEYNKPSFRG